MTFAFTFDKESAQSAGASPFITECGAYAGNLKEVKAVYGKGDSRSAGIEFGLTTPQGDASYLSLYVTKRDGTISPQGLAMLNAMVAIARIQPPAGSPLEVVAQMLEGKAMGVVLQKILQMKSDGVTETFKMDVKQVYHGGNMKTAKELYIQGGLAEEVARLVSTLTVKDERKKTSSYAPAGGGYQTNDPHTQQGAGNQGAAGYDSDLGW